MARRFTTPVGLVALASDPASGTAGDIYFNTTSSVLKIYTGSVWSEVTGGGGATAGNINTLTNLSNSWWLGA